MIQYILCNATQWVLAHILLVLIMAWCKSSPHQVEAWRGIASDCIVWCWHWVGCRLRMNCTVRGFIIYFNTKLYMYICISKLWTCSSWSCLLNFTCSYHFGDLHPMMFYMYIARMRRTRSEVSMINTAQTARMTSRLLLLYSCAMWIEPRLCTFSCLVYIKVYNSFVLVSTIFPWCGCWLLLSSAQGLQFFFPPPPV